MHFLAFDLDFGAGIDFLVTSQVHLAFQKRHHIWVESLPVRILEVISRVIVSVISDEVGTSGYLEYE